MTFYPFFVKGENVTEDLDKLGKITVLYRSWRIANFWNEFELHGRGAVKERSDQILQRITLIEHSLHWRSTPASLVVL